jgi:hypothetical protein
MIKTLFEITKSDKLNFILPYGLGDTMMCCSLKHNLEIRYKAKIHFIIKPSHTVIMKMYRIDDFDVYIFSETELWAIANENNVPQIGKLYVAHWIYSDQNDMKQQWFAGKFTMKQQYYQFFKINGKTNLTPPFWYPKITAEMEKSLGFPVPLKKIALLLPEARSVPALNHEFWNKLVKRLRARSLFVSQSYYNDKFAIQGVPNLPDDMETILAVAISCARVYSLCNGICDLIKEKTKYLTVFYSDKMSYKVFFLDGLHIKNVLVDQACSKNTIRLRKMVKNILKKIPPCKQILNRFDIINMRINILEQKINDLQGFKTNE